jgi:N-formylglutamate amidohydrolase
MRSCFACLIVVLCLLDSVQANAQTTDLVIAEPGAVAILLTAPHGGSRAIPGVPVRTAGNTAQDFRTRELTEMVRNVLAEELCATPYVVVADFHRRYLDANRSETEAFEHPDAEPVYRAYHGSIREFVDDINRGFGSRGMLIDVHGPNKLHQYRQ